MANINWLAVLVATLAYFFLGFLWYSVIFKNLWAKQMGMTTMTPPTGPAMMKLLGKSFAGNLLTVIGIAMILNYSHATGNAMRSMKIGAVTGFAVGGGMFWTNYNWA